MAWGRVDDGLYDHPKLDRLGRDRLAGVGLLTVAISWSNRRLTDGIIPTERVLLLGGTVALADKLVDAELFEKHPTGYLIHDFLDFNDSAETVRAKRDADAERQRRHRLAQRDTTDLSQRESRYESQRESRRDIGVTSVVTPDGVTPYARARFPSRPVPSREETPLPPASGGQSSRKNGTNPRAVSEREAQAKRQRGNERRLAYARGALTEEQFEEQSKRDAPLEEIPDWTEHQAHRVRESLIEGPLAELVDAG